MSDETKKEKGEELFLRLAKALDKAAGDDDSKRFDELTYADKLAKSLPPMKTVGTDWYAYQDGAWGGVKREAYLPTAMKVVPKRHRKVRHAKALVDHLEARNQVVGDALRGFHRFDESASPDCVLLNAANGVVRVTREGDPALEKHDPKWDFTMRAAARFDARAKCPTFLEALEQALPDEEDRKLLQLYCGNMLMPSARYEASLICYGPGGSGKSTLAEAILAALGNPGDKGSLVTALSMTQICNSASYSLPKLRLAAVNLGTELDTVELDESANFKQIVSGEAIEARGIYKSPDPVRSTCKLWFLANSLPRFKNGTAAELRRLRFIQFDRLAEAKKDPTLKERLPSERDGIFAWMVQGLTDLLALGEVPQGGARSRSIVEKFAVSNDPIGTFLRQQCAMGPNERTPKAWLLEAFKEFLEEHGLPEKMSEWFFRRLYEGHTDVKPYRDRTRAQDHEHWILGIRHKDSNPAALL